MSGKQRNIRKRRALDEEEEQEEEEKGPKLTSEDIKLLQKQRLRKTARGLIGTGA